MSLYLNKLKLKKLKNFLMISLILFSIASEVLHQPSYAMVSTSNPNNIKLITYILSKKFNDAEKLLLLDSDLDVNAEGPFGWTPLLAAIIKNSEQLVNILLEKNASQEKKGSLGNTPLHEAVKVANIGIIKTLLDHGADINQVNIAGQTPLDIAQLAQNKEIINLLLSKGNYKKNIQDDLTLAIINNNIEKLKLILENKEVDLNKIGSSHLTPLGDAIKSERTEIASLLMSDPRVDINKISLNFSNPLFFAVAMGSKNIVQQILIDKRINVNETDQEGNTAIHYAFGITESPEIIQMLLSHGADIHAKNSKGDSALKLAQKKGGAVGELVQNVFRDNLIHQLMQEIKGAKTRADIIAAKDHFYLQLKQNKIPLSEIQIDKLNKEISENAKNVTIKELLNQEKLEFSPVLEEHSKAEKGTCNCCYQINQQLYYNCAALNKNCIGKICGSCSQEALKALLSEANSKNPLTVSNNVLICRGCKQAIHPKFYEHIEGCRANVGNLEEVALRLKLGAEPLWKFCPGKNCINGGFFQENDNQHFECIVCSFKGCMKCTQKHLAGDPCNAKELEEKQLKSALDLGIHKKPYPIYARRLTPFEEHIPLMEIIYMERDLNKITQMGHKSSELTQKQYLEELSESEYYDAVYKHRDMNQFGEFSRDDYLLLGSYRPCPGCGLMIEKGPACWHMQHSCENGKNWNWDSGLEHPMSTIHDYHGVRNYRVENDNPNGTQPPNPQNVLPVKAHFYH